MSDESQRPPDSSGEGDPAAGPPPGSRSDHSIGDIQRQQLSARVPDAVSRGVFSTGAIVIGGPFEIMLDFVLRLVRPHQVVARVVLPPPVLGQFIEALTENLARFRDRFGAIPPLPRAQVEQPAPTVNEVYEELKLPDELIGGAYANAVIISHTPAEFCLDFIAGFFPRSAVTSRVYLSAPQTARLLETLTQTYQEYLRRAGAARQGPPTGPTAAPPGGAPPA